MLTFIAFKELIEEEGEKNDKVHKSKIESK